MRKRALLWLAGVALVVGALLLTDRLLWAPGLTEDNVRRIRPGMTLAKVEALLGGPGVCLMASGKGRYFLDYRWAGAEGDAAVLFRRDGDASPKLVMTTSFTRATRPPFLARLRAWFGW
jgi:hypothetical protein